MIIGRFDNQANGRITGELDALPVGSIPLTFEPNSKGADYTVRTETGCDAGAAWKRTSEKSGKTYVSVKLDSPFLPAPMNCALFPQKDGSQVLIWDRKPKDEPDTTAETA